MADTKPMIFFAHGKESGPWGTKIRTMAEIARERGFRVESPDYQGMDDAAERVDRLLSLAREADGPLVLVGSSMGGYVSAAASAELAPAGLFLLAPAFHMEGFPNPSPRPAAPVAEIAHGWDDDTVPVDNVIRYAREHACELHLLPAGHRLTEVLPRIETLFAGFLERVGA